MMERILERISLSIYKNKFILKGGMLITAMVGLDSRTTMDLDAAIRGQDMTESQIIGLFKEIIAVDIDDNILFDFKKIEEIMANMSGDEKTGAAIVLKALEAPLKQIVENAGLEGSVIVNKVKEKNNGTGYNVLTEEYVDMVKAGIIDPTKVARSALQNATSVASTLLTTEAVVADIKEPEPPMPAGGGMGMM